MKIIAWALHKSDPTMRHHAVTKIDASVHTACDGRWSATDSYELFRGADVTVEPRCQRCVELMREPYKKT